MHFSPLLGALRGLWGCIYDLDVCYRFIMTVFRASGFLLAGFDTLAEVFNEGDLHFVTVCPAFSFLVIKPSNKDPRTAFPRGATRRDVTRVS